MSTDAHNPLSMAETWNVTAEGYVSAAMPFLREFSVEAVNLAALTADDQVLDVACGPGTLSVLASERAAKVHAIDFSAQMVARCRTLTAGLAVEVQVMDGQALSFDDNTFDVAFSMFGLMFFPDRTRGFSELWRVLKPGGRVVVSSWAPLERSPDMQKLFAALGVAEPELSTTPPSATGLEDEGIFRRELAEAGFCQAVLHPVRRSMQLPSASETWDGLCRGAAPFVLARNRYADRWPEIRRRGIDYLERSFAPFPTNASSEALIGVARKR